MENKQIDVVMLLYGNIRYDGRVQKEIKTLKKYGKKVLLILSNFDKDDNIKNYDFDIKIIKNIICKQGGFFTFLNIFFFNLLAYFYIRKKKVKYIHCNDLNTMFLSYLFKKKGKIIFDSHELFPEAQLSNVRRFVWNIIEKINVKNATLIIQAEKNRKKYFIEKYKLSEEMVEVIENLPLNQTDILSKDYFKTKYNYVTDKKILTYIGVINRERCILEILKGIKDIKDIVFFCIGNYSDLNYKKQLIEFIEQNNLNNRIFLKESIPQTEVLKATNSSDISIIFYKNNNLNNYYCASNKLYECLNCQIKILTNNYPGIREVTEGVKTVFRINEISDNEIKKGIEYLLNVKDKTLLEFYWENQEEKFIKIYGK